MDIGKNSTKTGSEENVDVYIFSKGMQCGKQVAF